MADDSHESSVYIVDPEEICSQQSCESSVHLLEFSSPGPKSCDSSVHIIDFNSPLSYEVSSTHMHSAGEVGQAWTPSPLQHSTPVVASPKDTRGDKSLVHAYTKLLCTLLLGPAILL